MDSSESPPPIGHVFFSGLNEPCSLDSIVEVVVNTQGGGLAPAAGQVQVYATSPIGLNIYNDFSFFKRRCEVIRREDSFTASFTPDRIGKWLIGILYNGEHINGSQFTCHVFDSSMVHVYGLDVGLVGQELKFTVDASRAGKGEVKTSVSVNGTQISSTIREEPTGSGIHRVRFTPQGPGKYKISTVFNNQPVKGSPFLLDIADSNAVHVYGDQLQMAAVDRLATFFVHAAGVDSRDLACIISGPSGKKKHARLIPLDETTFKAEWKPVETGEHRIDVLVLERPVPESPFSCQIGDPDLVTVRRMPQKIEGLHKSHQFEIDATAAGSGNLEIVINGGRVACQVQETTPRHFLAQFVPDQAVKHTVEMRFNGFSVHDSPWLIPFIDASVGPSGTRMLEGRKREEELMRYDDDKEDIITELIGAGLTRAVVGQPASFEIRSNSRLRASNVSVRIMDMEHGRPVELQLSEHGPGIVRCQYTLPRVSDYEILVYINGRRVDTEDLIVIGFDPKRVRVHLKGSAEDFRPGKPAQFIVDAAEAGKGQLEISVNQGQVPNNVQMQDAGRCLVTFIPQHAGSYAIDVTFNGLQVHGCPIKVDVRERQVGKPVSAPVYARPATSGYGATVAGTSPPPTRGPSSAYHSSASPHVDTTTFSASSYAPSPSSPTAHPRSPVMVAAVHSPSEQRRQMGDLRSPALVARQVPTGKGLLGYTVAQYGSKEKIVSTTTTTTSGLDSSSRTPLPQPSVTPLSPRHKYFGEHEEQKPVVSAMTSHQAPTPGLDSTPADSAQFEMTRSAELTLFRERPPSSADTGRRQIPIHHIYDRVPDEHLQRLPTSSPLPASHTHKANDLPYAPLDQRARKTVEWIRSKFESSEGEGPTATVVDVQHRDSSKSAASGTMSPVSPPQGQIQTHIVEPYSSDIETAMTPGTRRRLLEHSVYKATDLKESAGRSYTEDTEAERRSGAATTDHEESEAPSSKHSSKATTPRLSLKFRGNKDKVAALEAISPGGGTGFDWSKSKISSKHEVVRRNKEVDVRIDGLKLAKEDQLKVVVVPPSLSRHQPADQPAQQPPELPHKLKKIGNKSWEVSFRPSEVGTHKVLIFVNNLPHPQTPFPIRVYDAGQIVVGEIVRESVLNDTVEFTVDAGRAGFGNLEMAIKDHEGIIIPSHVSQLEVGAAKFLVTFTPSSPGTHTVHITFNKEVIKGSPFEVLIVEPPSADGSPMPGKKGKKEKKNKEKQSLNGAGSPHSKSSSKEFSAPPPPGRSLVSKMPSLSRVGKPVELLVTLPRPEDLVQAQVHDLDREQLPVQIVPQQQQSEGGGSTVVRVLFSPKRVGDHEVDIRVGGIEVEGSPFTCRVYDPAKILVGGIPSGNVDKPVSFIVDASQAGVGNLEVAVNEGKIPSMAHAMGQHKYEITFVPKEPIDHQISVRFNNEPVPGSPFICPLAISQQHHQPMHFSASGPGLERIPVGQMTEFFIDAHLPTSEGPSLTMESLPRVQITDPRGEPLPVDVAAYEDEPTRTVVKYTPRSVGNHQISIKWNGQPIGGSPFTAKAFDASCVKLALDGEGGQVSRACTFTIDAAKAGAGNMEIIVSVGKRNVPNYVQAEGQARFRVSFTPQEPQEHQISVKFNGVSVPGSPMRCPVLPAPPRSPRPSRSESQVDKGERETAGGHLAVSPTSYNHPHPDIPQVVEPMTKTDEEELRLVGDMTSAQIGHPKRFSIDAPPGTGRVDCNVVVIGPDKRRVPVEKQRVDGGSFDITFTPNQIGDHHIDIQINGRSLAICPIVCHCYGPSGPVNAAATVEKEPSSGRPLCGRDYMFKVELPKRTRKEHLSAELYSLESHQQLPLHLDTHPSGDLALCSFRALQKPQAYQFTLYRDGGILDERVLEAMPEPGPAEPVELLDLPDPILVEHTARFELARTSHNQLWLDEDGLPSVQIFDPSGSELAVHLHCLPDGRIIRADWQPQSEGRHRVHIRDADGQRQLCGSPLPVTVLDLSAVRVVGLRNDVVGTEQTFTLDWSNSGGQSARVLVHHASGEPVKCIMRRVKRGIHEARFTPRIPGLHLLTFLIDGMELPECPYECLISDKGSPRARGDALTKAQRAKTARFEVTPGTSTAPHADLDVVVTNPQGSPLPVRCYKQQDDSYWVEFTPEVCGAHNIEVTFADVPVHGSPFHCEVIDPKRVQVHGIDRPFSLRTLANFVVDRKAAGNGPLSAELVDPHGDVLKMDRVKNSRNEDSFTFLPIKLGQHRLSLKLAGFSVPGSPFLLLVEEQRAPAVYGSALDYAIERGQQASMIFDANKQPGGLKVEVRSPTGERVRHSTNRRPDECTEIVFHPQDVGHYEVTVDFNNRPVHGSPYSVAVVDPAKVVVKDSNFRPDGMLQLHVNQRNLIDVDATAAGPAKLRAEVRDAEGELLAGEQQAHVHSLGYGKFQLALTPRRAEKYKIYLYCSELVVPSAYPLLAVAEPPSTNGGPPISQTTVDGLEDRMAEQHIAERRKETATTDLSKVILRGEGLSVARVREPAEFIVDASEVRRGTPLGKCTASLHGEKADVPVKMSALRNQVFKGVYTPLMGGTYQLTIQIDGQPIPGSPRNVQVLSHSHPADLIEVDGRSLKVGIIGEDLRTIIDARRADPGQISAQCSGPSGPEYCELLDNRDGTYVLRVQPKELGPHTLIIKYENEHVRGSPFSFNVSHPPDPTKVKVYGPGIEHGILHSFKSNFVVETKGAGAGQLTVRVRGPRGAFNVEMQRDREHERTIHCKYEPREPGDYQVDVKWHGQNVPGSPFFVLIVDTEQELQRFFAGGVPSPTPPSPFMPPGWLPPGPPGIMPGPPAPSIMPPPHFVKGSGRATPGSSVSGIPMPIQIQHHHPPHHYGHGPPARAPPYHPQQQPVYGRQHH